ncbi:MAG: hypothetical protein N2507_02450 [Candidatus Bipolaricaulota bacterium]|nr:hypothetical protein [Candidatus Bipolaricaulota bacterium]
MSKGVGLVVGLLVGFWGLQAAEIAFEPAPRLLGTFALVVRGVAADQGEAVLFNAATGQRLVLPLERHGPVLRTPPILAVRPCDPRPAGQRVHLLEVTGVGELLVAATALGQGLSAAAKVGPREGRCELLLEAKEGEEWKPVQALGAGEYRVRLVCPPADRTCQPDPLPRGLRVRLGQTELTLDLLEDGNATGHFVWTFSSAFALDRERPELLFVLRWEDRAVAVAAEQARLILQVGEKELGVPVPLLPVEVQPATALLVPAGCRAQLELRQPAEPDEVLWWVPGRGWFAGVSLELAADEPLALGVPRYPEALLAKVFVRKGAAWGATQVAVSIAPRPRLLFVDPKTGEEIRGPWPAAQEFRIRMVDPLGFPGDALAVYVGKLGPQPLERRVELRPVEGGVYESAPLSPRLWQAKPGEFLWAQVRYPAPVACVVSVLLPLR